MPPKKKAETKPKAAAKSKAAPKAKAEPKPKAPRASQKTAAEKKIAVPEVSRSKKTTAVTPKPAPARPTIPASSAKKFPRKGETQMLAFVRDPQCIFTYWEVTPESIESVKQQLQEEFKGSAMVLRVFHSSGPGREVQLVREIFVDSREMNRYIDIDEKTGNYFFEIAQKAASGRLVVYVRSNPIQMGYDPSSAPVGSTPGSPLEMPAGLQDYFSQEEYAEILTTPGGPSSAGPHAEILRKKKGRYAASSTGPRA